ncbi:MAG TPA: hypothetical protein VHN79_14485 [Lacunisphaera sp.]|nr:hypothetical protein [Lacunisphaera sp.]
MPLAPASRARLQATMASAGTLAFWLWRGGAVPAILAGTMAALALLAWTSPVRYAPVQRGLDRLIHLLLVSLTWLLLGLVYLLVFTPLRVFRALTGRDALARAFDRSATTYLQIPRTPGPLDRQF